MRPSFGPSSQWGSTGKSKVDTVPSVRTTRLADSSGPTGTSGCGRFGTSSIALLNSSSPTSADSSAAAIRSPTVRWAAIARSRSARSVRSRIALEDAVRSARSCSTACSASRRRRSASRSASTCEAWKPTLASSAFTRSGSARIRRMSSIEGAAHVLDGRRIGVEADPHHVEARVAIVPAARREEVACDAHHLRLLAADHRFERGAGDGAATAPHLDEDEHVAVEGDQVDLAGAAAVVPGHDRVAAGAQELLGHRLPAPPELPPPIHGRRDYSAHDGVATAPVSVA